MAKSTKDNWIYPTWGSATENLIQDFKNNVVSSTVKLVPSDFGIALPFILYEIWRHKCNDINYDVINMFVSIWHHFLIKAGRPPSSTCNNPLLHNVSWVMVTWTLDRMMNRHDWKNYLLANSLIGGNDAEDH